jgi:NAD(P)-dependent dehydrogenase (short-subunit alcohol dehydrogenase family)
MMLRVQGPPGLLEDLLKHGRLSIGTDIEIPTARKEDNMLDAVRLDDKVAVVTGAGGVIGTAAARLMARRGARVVAVDRDEACLDNLKKSDSAISSSIVADVTREQDVARYADEARRQFGRIDIFFNNAGIEGPVHPITEYPLTDFERVMSVNVVGVFLGLKHVIPIMAAHGGGSIINTSSVSGLNGTPGICAYNASKHAVMGLTGSAAAEWAGRGVRINSINPGPIVSRMMQSLETGMASGQKVDADQIHATFEGLIPAGRYGTPEEVATMVAYLASDDARYLNGAFFTIDGGLTVS